MSREDEREDKSDEGNGNSSNLYSDVLATEYKYS